MKVLLAQEGRVELLKYLQEWSRTLTLTQLPTLSLLTLLQTFDYL